MLMVHGTRGVTQKSLDAFRKEVTKPFDYLALISYAHGGNGKPDLHGFVFVRDMGRVVDVVTDGFASGYSGEGPRGLVEALKLMPPQALIFDVRYDNARASALFEGQVNRIAFLDSMRSPRTLRVVWGAEGRSSIAELDPDSNCLYISAQRINLNMEPVIARPT